MIYKAVFRNVLTMQLINYVYVNKDTTTNLSSYMQQWPTSDKIVLPAMIT
jgi:hypothetical protein